MSNPIALSSKVGQACDIVAEPLQTTGAVDFRFIELMFFAYRQFTTDADTILASYGFGRAHHRVLHFVNRSPGITIADLLDLLKITKQSLSRVLRQLIDDGFVAQLPGSTDRRQRRLYPTQKGRDLTLELSRQQAARIDAAIGKIGTEGASAVASFLVSMGGGEDPAKAWLETNVLNEGPVT
ncbi:MarR family transcriptional regulator [Fulvimarina sp. 2208YS6-2-32]|uniref:MarR family transcriptional regulator n=1 Tax=Fulvimarina uroteuthidis TaxID=3098149 RepID=A0ABU5I0S7_9HYPH|nr:MarR family transcriptional regulator [Fulvimarina sp. 2208YS6-2-32]MDY8108992.1 MarR family transcriptional regulator [Fulvimarina sp. 2208YS6-2-32]